MAHLYSVVLVSGWGGGVAWLDRDGNGPPLAGEDTDVVPIEETEMGETTGEASSSGLMVDLIISLDGYASAEGWPGWWGLEGPEYLAWLEQEGEKGYTFLLGANTYRLMSSMSEEAAAQGSAFSANEGASLTGLAAVPKVVFSSTLGAPLTWPNSELVTGDAVEAVTEMKRSGSGPLSTLGSLSLCRSLDSRTFDGRLQLLEYVPTVLNGPPGSGPT